jgi:hypothetical protein
MKREHVEWMIFYMVTGIAAAAWISALEALAEWFR